VQLIRVDADSDRMALSPCGRLSTLVGFKGMQSDALIEMKNRIVIFTLIVMSRHTSTRINW